MAATWTLEFPYRRSVGPVIGAFLGGLRDRRVLGVRTAGGRVLVPPLEYDPETGEAAGEMVEVGQAGVVRARRRGSPSRCAPPARPAVRVGARAARRRRHRAAARGRLRARPERRRPGTRVRIRWADETEGKITDIECFEPEAVTVDRAEPGAVHVADDGGGVQACPRPSALAQHIGEAIAEGRIIGHKCPECGKVYVPPRGYCPLCVGRDRRGRRGRGRRPRGTITTFSVITPLQYQGQEETEDYVQATILLDGADTHDLVMQRIDGIPIADVHTGCASRRCGRREAERKRQRRRRRPRPRRSARRSRAGSRPANPTRRSSRYAELHRLNGVGMHA